MRSLVHHLFNSNNASPPPSNQPSHRRPASLVTTKRRIAVGAAPESPLQKQLRCSRSALAFAFPTTTAATTITAIHNNNTTPTNQNIATSARAVITTTPTVTATTAAALPPTNPTPFAAATRLPFATTSISSPSPSPSPSKAPSTTTRHRHQDARSLTAHETTTAAQTRCATLVIDPKMPPGPDRTRQPQLAAVPAKLPAVNRSPLTPKVAAKAPLVTPLVRRSQNLNAAVASPQPLREDAPAGSPAIPFLGNNITPRSGTRQTRVESTNTTPSGTPNAEKTVDMWDNGTGANNRPGLASSALANDPLRPSAALSPGDASSESSDINKFFYASDAKSVQQAPPRPASVPQKSSTFFYANGISADNKRTATPPANPSFTPVLSTTQEPAATKFFYANGTPDVSSRPSLPTSAVGSTVSSTSRMAPGRPTTSGSTTSLGLMQQRPVSPVKNLSSQSTYTLRMSPVPAPPTSPVRQQMASPPGLAQAPVSTTKRRVSIDASSKPARDHSRTGSMPSSEQVMPLRLSTGSTESTSSTPHSPSATGPAMTMASILQAAEDLREEEESRGGDSRSEVHSPTKSTRFSEPVSDLVANARRERKVQDLEITNASLEAINRTLERQLRKQTAELRRYRRLSRSGRLSLTSAASSRVSSLALTEPPAGALSDLSEEDATEEEEEDEDDLDSLDETDYSDTEAGSNPMSPDMRLTTRRKRDEIRLQLDLTKHQELLVDSQKMNQSLKRCLNWTEVLIKEGQKALEYHVRVSDVEFGGRVLAPPDDDDDEDTSYVGDDTLTSVDTGLEPPWSKGPQDRDSGIELPPEIVASSDNELSS